MSKPSDSFTFPRTGHVVRNRSVLAAMTNKQSHTDGTLSDAEINWLVKRAEGGFGIMSQVLYEYEWILLHLTY